MANLGSALSTADQSAYRTAVKTLVSNTLTLGSKAQTRVDLERAFLTGRSQQSRQAVREKIEKLG